MNNEAGGQECVDAIAERLTTAKEKLMEHTSAMPYDPLSILIPYAEASQEPMLGLVRLLPQKIDAWPCWKPEACKVLR